MRLAKQASLWHSIFENGESKSVEERMDGELFREESPPESRIESPGLCISLLGKFSIWFGLQEIPATSFARPKALQLLKFIALQPGQKIHRDRILDQLWPHLKPGSAASQLYKAVHHVRQALAAAEPSYPVDTLLQSRNEMISLQAPAGVHTDVEAFERMSEQALQTGTLDRLQRAVACYKGDLLPGELYEEWTVVARGALRERLLDLLLELGRCYDAAGRLAEAADALREVLKRDSLREDAHRTLMHVYARQGSRSRALRHYQHCADLLANELGVEPSAETEALHDAIRQGRIVTMPPIEIAPTTEQPLLPPLVGRRAEIDLLHQKLQQVEGGKGAVLSLEGPAGIGKTRFAQEIVHVAQQQIGPQRLQVWIGGAHEQEGQSPYLPVIEALRKAVRDDYRDAHLLPAEIAAAIPELSLNAEPIAIADHLAAQHALFAAILRFLAGRASRTPVVLILDDLHAADPGTLKLFHYLARQTPNFPFLLIGIWRTGESSALPLFDEIIGNLQRQHLLRRLTLSPLSRAEHDALLEQTLQGEGIDSELAAEIYRLTVGNPLFTQEMVRQLLRDQQIVRVENIWRSAPAPLRDDSSAVPPSVQDLVRRRLEQLSIDSRHLLDFAATVGHEISLLFLEEWSRGENTILRALPLWDALDELIEAQLLQEQGLGYRFPHPLFREAIYHNLSLARRRALHLQIATELERRARELPDAPVEAIAFHYHRSGDVRQAVHYLVEAGDRARSVFDHDSALRRYREALTLLEEESAGGQIEVAAEVQERIGDVHRAVGHVARSLAAYLQALETLSPETKTASQARRRTLHRKITLAAVLTPDIPTAAEHLARAWELLEDDAMEQARMLITQSLFDWHANQLEAAIQHASEALHIAERNDQPVEASQACEMLAMAHLPLGDWEQGFHYELRRQTPDWSPEIVVAVDAHLCLYQFRLQGTEPYQAVRNFIEKVAEQATTLGNLRCLAVCHYVLGSLALFQGRLPEASESLDQALKLHQRIGSPAAAAYTLARQIELLTATGAAEQGGDLVQVALDLADQAAIRDHCLMLVHVAAIRNRLAAADMPAAQEIVAAAEEHDAQAATCSVCSVERYAALAAFYVEAGNLEKAQQLIKQALQIADFAHNRLGRARALQVQGQIHSTRDERTEAAACLTAAAEIFRLVDDRYDLALTLSLFSNLPDSEEEGQQKERESQRREAQRLLQPFRRFVAS